MTTARPRSRGLGEFLALDAMWSRLCPQDSWLALKTMLLAPSFRWAASPIAILPRHLILVITTVTVPTVAVAQEHTGSSAIADAKFQIVQSPTAARLTIRLNRFTGETDQLVRRPQNQTLHWQRIGFAGQTPYRDAKPRYVLFISALAARFTFLIDTVSGVTWQLVTGEDDEYLWEQIDRA